MIVMLQIAEQEVFIEELHHRIAMLQEDNSALLKQVAGLMRQNMRLRDDYEACMIAASGHPQRQISLSETPPSRRCSAPLLATVSTWPHSAL